MADITERFDYKGYVNRNNVFQDTEFIHAMLMAKAYVSGGSVLQSIRDNPYYDKGSYADIDIYVNLKDCQPLLDFFSDKVKDIDICHATPYDNSFFKKKTNYYCRNH